MYGDESQQLGLSMKVTSRGYENLERRQGKDVSGGSIQSSYI